MSNTENNSNIQTLNREDLTGIDVDRFDIVRRFVRKANNWHRAIRRYRNGEGEFPSQRRNPSKVAKLRAYEAAWGISGYDRSLRPQTFADLARLVGEVDAVTPDRWEEAR